MTLSFLPTVGTFLSFLGYIFLGVALYRFKDEIFSYFLVGAVLSFMAMLLLYFKLFAILMSLLLAFFSNNPLIPITLSVIVYILAYYILQILAAFYFKKSFTLLEEEINGRFFTTGGILVIVGAVLSPFLIGVVIWIVGWFVVLIGFLVQNEILEAEVIEQEKLPKN
jgi:uncharacterized membrane protein